MTTVEILKRTKNVWRDICNCPSEKKNEILNEMAASIEEYSDLIIAANKEDMKRASGQISDVMLDRLYLDKNRIKSMADGIRDIVKLDDGIGEVFFEKNMPNGMTIYKKRVPFGLIAIIYESRPNVTSDAAALAIKSGNCCVLRCGKEAYATAYEIVKAIKSALKKCNIDEDVVNIVDDISRSSADDIMKANGIVDLLIPRGGAGLIKSCIENATVPCIQTGTGICHIYVDKYADYNKAIDIIVNAKTSRPSVCNAAEVCIIHKEIAREFLPLLKDSLVDSRIKNGLAPVELRLDEYSRNVIDGKKAESKDFDTEFLDYILAVKTVDSIDDAIQHILDHSTGHSEAIITEDKAAAEKFVAETDSSAVYVNVSTRFTDGGEFGLGCEMGISTQKLHARGPMGLLELTTYKYIIKGNGQVR